MTLSTARKNLMQSFLNILNHEFRKGLNISRRGAGPFFQVVGGIGIFGGRIKAKKPDRYIRSVGCRNRQNIVWQYLADRKRCCCHLGLWNHRRDQFDGVVSLQKNKPCRKSTE